MGPIETEVHGVKCDAPGCGWADMTVPRCDYPRWRNAPCPQCGANVFTDADWKAMRRVELMVGAVNLLLFWWPRPKRSQPHYVTEYQFAGRGIERAVTQRGESEPLTISMFLARDNLEGAMAGQNIAPATTDEQKQAEPHSGEHY